MVKGAKPTDGAGAGGRGVVLVADLVVRIRLGAAALLAAARCARLGAALVGHLVQVVVGVVALVNARGEQVRV